MTTTDDEQQNPHQKRNVQPNTAINGNNNTKSITINDNDNDNEMKMTECTTSESNPIADNAEQVSSSNNTSLSEHFIMHHIL